MDKMRIIGSDGKAKYELSEDNKVVDLRGICTCEGAGRPEQRNGDTRICLICELPIVS
jgi:hypothetical protein